MNKELFIAIADNLEELIDEEGQYQCVGATDRAMNNLQIADAQECGDLLEIMTTSLEDMNSFEADLARAFAGVISPEQFLSNWRKKFDKAKVITLNHYHDEIWDMWCDVRDDGFREE